MRVAVVFLLIVACAAAAKGPRCGKGYCGVENGVCCGESGFCCPANYQCTQDATPQCIPADKSKTMPPTVVNAIMKGFSSLEDELRELLTQEHKDMERLGIAVPESPLLKASESSESSSKSSESSSKASESSSSSSSSQSSESSKASESSESSKPSSSSSSSSPASESSSSSSESSESSLGDLASNSLSSNSSAPAPIQGFNYTDDIRMPGIIPVGTRVVQYLALQNKYKQLNIPDNANFTQEVHYALQYIMNRLTGLLHGTTYAEQYKAARQYIMYAPKAPNDDKSNTVTKCADSCSSSPSSSSCCSSEVSAVKEQAEQAELHPDPKVVEAEVVEHLNLKSL